MVEPKTKTEKFLDSMRNLILRPLAVFSLSFYIISCVLFTVGGAFMLIPSAVFFVFSAVFAVLSYIKRKNVIISSTHFVVFMLLSGIAFGFLSSYINFEARLSGYLDYDGRTVEISGHVEEVTVSKPYMGVYVIETDSFDGKEKSLKIKLTADAGLDRGDRVSGSISVTALCDSRGRPTADGKMLLPDGIMLKGESEDLKYDGLYSFPLFSRFTDMRYRLTAYLTNTLGDERGGLASALLSGDRSRLPESLHRDFKRLGISHVIAISGMHLSVICGVALFITKHLNAYLRYAVQCAVVLFYMFFTGFTSSVVRAGIMVLIACLAFFVRREADMITGIGIAVLTICIFDPFAPGDVALQLSAAAVMAIALAMGTAKKKDLVPEKRRGFFGRLQHTVISSLFVSFAVIIFLLPLEYYYYGCISPFAPISSLVMTFMASVLLWLLPFLLISIPLPLLNRAIGFVISLICDGIFYVSGVLSRIPDICVTIIFPFSAVLCFFAFAAFIVFSVTRKKVRLISGIVCLCLFLSLIFGGYAYTFSHRGIQLIYPSNHLKNDAVTFLFDEKATVIDVSDGNLPNIAEAASFPGDALYTEIENIVITHLHNTCKSSLPSILSENIVRNLYIPYTDEYSLLCDDIRNICDGHQVKLHVFRPGDELSLTENVSFHLYEYEYIKRSVQPMVRFDLQLSDTLFTYLSSSYSELHPEEKIDADIVFLGDHGPLYKKDVVLDLSSVTAVTAFGGAKPYYHGTLNDSPFYVLQNGRLIPLNK